LFLIVVLPAFAGSSPPQTAAALRLENEQLAIDARSAVLELYALEARLATSRARLALLREQDHRLRRERVDLRTELRVARIGQRHSERRLASRLRRLYEQREVSPIEIVFGARSLDQAVTELHDLGRVATLNDEVLAQLRSAKRRVNRALRALASRRAELAAETVATAATEASLVQAEAARTAYIADLNARRDLNEAQIELIESQARAAAARSQRLTTSRPSAVAVGAVPVPFSAGGRSLTVSATAYSLPGRTATGVPVGYGVVAVDPSVIPLGTHLTVPGYGEAVAADVGSAVIGASLDLWFPSVTQAQAWGRHTVTITLH
jgi:cystine transport system substrate-binding protein